MRKTFEIPPNNGKYSLFLRPLLQDAESVCNYEEKIFTSNELTKRNEKFTKHVEILWGKFCNNESLVLTKEEAAKLFEE
jgi:16S rRNA C1402 (ribose-2'-O) methylase RsmI